MSHQERFIRSFSPFLLWASFAIKKVKKKKKEAALVVAGWLSSSFSWGLWAKRSQEKGKEPNFWSAAKEKQQVLKMNPRMGCWKTTFLFIVFLTYAQRVHQRLVFWNSIHQEVASDSFCFLINYSWLLVFILYVFSFFLSGFNLYWWKGYHFS